MANLGQLILVPTPQVQPENYRAYAFLAVGMISAFVVHIVATTLFAVAGVYEMVGLNLVFSLPAYAIAFFWNRKGWHVESLVVAVVELCIHQSLAAWLVGPGTGLQWFLFVVPAAAFYANPRHWWIPAGMIGAATVIALGIETLSYTPIYTFRPESLVWVNALSIGTVFILLALFGFEYARTAGRIDGWLRARHAEALETLRHSEAALRTWFEASADGQATIDPVTGAVLRANPAMVEMLARPEERIGDLRMDEFVVEDHGAEPTWLQRMVKNPVSSANGVALRRPDGTELVVDTTAARAVIEGRDVLLVSFRDVTQRRQLESVIARSERLANVGLLASGVAHEINNPLSIVLNYGELVGDEVPKESTAWEYAKQIRIAAERVATIVRNLQTFAKPPELSPSPVDIVEVVDRASNLIAKLLNREGIVLELELPADLPRVLCRSGNASQVIMNVLTNARDALNARYPAPSKEKRITIRAACVRIEDKEGVRVTIQDYGTGIPPEHLDRIFHPFFTTKRQDKCSGLGLSLSQTLMQEDQGRILVESVVGKGSSFHIEWTVASDPSVR